MSYPLYADDTKLCITFTIGDEVDEELAGLIIEACIAEIREWMAHHKLKLNDDKTEYQLVVSSQNSDKVAAKPIRIGESKIPPTPSSRNIGVMFDENMNLDIQIKKVCQACLFWLRNIRQIKRCLTVESTQALVQSLVLSRLDYCNSLYHGLPKFQISKLQRIQNSSARLITCTPYHEHWACSDAATLATRF